MSDSNKLLAVTTQSVEPSRLKKVISLVSQDGQMYDFVGTKPSLIFLSWQLVSQISSVWSVSLSPVKDIVIFSSKDPLSTLKNSSRWSASFVLDTSESSSFQITDTSLTFDGELLFDTNQWFWNTGLNIILSDEMLQWYSRWNLLYQGKQIWSLFFVRKKYSLDMSQVMISNTASYEKIITFSEWTTNGKKWIWIVDVLWIFEEKWNTSIEDSDNYELWIWFRSDFKNITLFADGKTVGESTIPFASPFVINFWDPVLSRISDNQEISNVSLDLGIGDIINAEPWQSLLKVVPIDFNNDSLEDLLAVFTDGSIKLLKNYGGTHPYSDMQNLVYLSDSIKDVFVGDVDANNYPDILIRTAKNQLRVYTNNKWVIDVDGKLICLNINASQDQISTLPASVDWLQQLFFEDMDKDGNIDIITNDLLGDIKIFYWWSTKNWNNYVSTLPYACDTHWYNRQKDSIKLIKSFGVVVDSDYYIQDESLVHIKWWNIINQTWSVNENSSQNSSSDELPPSFDSVLNNFDPNSFVSLMSNYSQELANDQLLNNYTLSPISYIPSYEKELSQQDIWYKTLLQLSWNTNISIYKTYQDTNSWALLSWDNVKITTTVLWLKNNIQATYIDKLLWPWNIVADQNNVIVSFQKESGNFDPTKDIVRLNASDNLFILDNISLDKSDFLRFSYEVTYVWEPSVSIDVKDFSSLDNNKKLDTYFDILVSPLDSCKKSQWIFFNISNQNHRSYEEKFEDIQSKIDDLAHTWQQEGEKILADAVPSSPQNVSSGDIEECDEWCASSVQNSVNDIYSQISNLGNMQDVFESWNVANLFSSWTISNLLTSSTNSFEINMDSVNTMLAPVTDWLDKILNWLCEWFKLWQSSCKPPFPFNYIPFNQAFLAPWNYHIFWCTPTLPNPLWPLFTLINQKFWAGFPAIFFPWTLQTPVGPIPMIWSSFVPIVQQMPWSDWFWLSPGFPPSWWIYPSQIRLYIVPTLTLEMGVALCFGPYAVGTNIPPLLRDLWGNCIVTSFPLYSCWWSQNTGTDIVTTESLDPWILDATRNWSCEQPLQVWSAKVLSNTIIVQQQTHVSPFRLSSRGSENSSWTMAVPRWNFWWFGYISFSSKPTKQTTTYTKTSFNTTLNLDPMQFFEWPTIDLKIKDSNAQGIIKILVKDWMWRQIKYMVNNLTKLTVNVTLPELSQMADWFGWLFSAANWSWAIASAKKDDFSKVDTSKAKNSLDKIKIIASSKQGYQQATDYANNPFESLITMFESVPLVDLSTRDIIFNIPLLTTDEIVKYESYLRSWLKNQQQTLKQWLEAFHEIASVCGGIDSNSAATQLSLLQEERKLIDAMKDTKTQQQLKTSLEKEESFLKKIVESKTITPDSNLIVNDIPAVLSDMWKQLTLFSEKIQSLPRLNFIKNCLTTESTDDKCYPWSSFDESEKKTLLSSTQQKIDNLSACATFSTSVDGFSEFYSEVTLLVRNVQQNIQILQQYKDFPLQLYKWMHFVDKYMSDILWFVSTFSSTLISWVNVNARIYAKWIDSLILIMTAIETYQVIIDISANWTKNCGTCSRDGYGAYWCSLSFLFPQIPIIPIPPFKIPNINIDLSHIDLGINIVLPRFIFVPISLPMPQLPNIPAPVDFNLAWWLDFDFTFNFDSYDIPEIPILPSPPVLPDLPSFIPKLDFSLPTLLPPAPKIPNITQEFSVTLDTIELVSKVFCILKQGIGLVGEKWIKSRVEQMTQRTWDVPIFDFFDQTVNWWVDKKLEWFDLQFDWFLQFKMDFSLFHWFLEQVASVVNSIPYTVSNAISWAVNTWSFGKALNTASSGYTKVKEFLEQDIGNVNLTFPIPAIDIDVSPLLSQTDWLEYSVAHSQLSTELQKIKSRMDDNFSMTQKLDTMISSINTPAKISPASQQLQMLQKEIESVVVKKQTEVRQLAKTIWSYDRFIAHLERNDIALVDDERLDISLSSPLFVTDQETYKRIQSQKSPLEAYMDTNSSLVDWYYQTLLWSDPNDLNMTKSDYEKTTDYLWNLQSTINSTYAKLWFQRKSYSSCSSPFLLASQELSNTSSPNQSTSSTTVSPDLSPYVRGIFVEDTLSWKMVNVVKSDSFINAIDDNYFSVDINKNGKEDVVMRDNNNIYIKYANQKSEFKNARMYKNLHVYTPPVFKFSYIDSYDDLLNKIVDENGYASFNGILVKVASPAQEIKNFKVTGQSFDAIQMSWLNQNTLWDTVDWYLLKLNHRIDTYNDKNILYRFLDDELLSKKYILLLPENTKYDSSLIDFKETYYYKSKSSSKPRNILEFLSWWSYSWVIADIQFYKPSQQTISLWLQDIPRNWQYTEVVSLKNEWTVNKPRYIPSGPWSNQIVAWRQIVADTIWPEVIITLERPSISQVVSTWSTHKWYVWTNYSLTLDWLDNVGISKMWIEQDNKIIYTKQWNALSGRVQLTGLYFTWATSLEYIVWAEDFSKNKQIQKVILNIEVPEITMKKFVPLSESSGQLIAELSHDIDQWMVVFQRERNNVWQEFSGTLANSFWWFFVWPKQTIITGSIFSLGNTIWLYDTASNEIGSISIDGNISLLPKYQDMYVLSLDLLTGTPLLRVVNKTSWNTVFWIQIPSYGLQNITLYQKEPFYSKVDLTQSSFWSFVWWSCIQSLDKECLLYISPKGSVYIPRDASSTLTGEYRYDTINRRVIYVIKDSLWKDIVSIAIKTNLIQ